MTTPGFAEVREVLIAELGAQLAAQGRTVDLEAVTDDDDLLVSGLIDSLGLLELAAALNQFCGFELDFSSLGPDELTLVGPLCEFVAEQVAQHRSGVG